MAARKFPGLFRSAKDGNCCSESTCGSEAICGLPDARAARSAGSDYSQWARSSQEDSPRTRAVVERRQRRSSAFVQPGGRRRLDMHVNTVDRIRKRFVLDGEELALNRKIREVPAILPKIDGRVEAHLIAICCGKPPEGRTRWTLRLLTGELKRNGLVTSVCVETVRKALKKTNCSLGASGAGASRNGITRVLSPKWRTSSTSTRRSTRPKSR